KGLRLGLPKEYFEGLGAATGEVIHSALKDLERLGCVVSDITLPHTKYALSCYYIIATAEASSNLARYDGVRYSSRTDGATLSEMYRNSRGDGFGPEVKR